MKRERAEAIIRAVRAVQAQGDDRLVSQAAALCRTLHQDGGLISAGTRINWHGTVLRAAVDLYDNAQSTPDAAPALWESIGYRDGFRIIPEHITPGLAFARGERGWWQDTLWESTMDGNVWTPAQKPELWTPCPAGGY